MNKDTSISQLNNPLNKQTNAKPNCILVLILRILSILITYGMCILLQYIKNNSNDFPQGIYLMVVIIFIALLFFLLGVIGSGKTVVSVWKKIGTIFLLIL